MNTRMLSLFAVLSLGLSSFAAAAQPSQEQLEKEAKITRAEAQKTALARVPGGAIKSAEIEREKGHLVWSFDIARQKTRDITEILVDAKTGRIISTQTETPSDQAKEAAADRKARH